MIISFCLSLFLVTQQTLSRPAPKKNNKKISNLKSTDGIRERKKAFTNEFDIIIVIFFGRSLIINWKNNNLPGGGRLTGGYDKEAKPFEQM